MRYTVNPPYLTFYIDETFSDKSIEDLFHFYHLSRKTIHLLKQNKDYTLNKQYVKADTILHPGDALTVKAYDQDDGLYPPVFAHLDVVYEDEILLIVNKPPYIGVYPDDKEKTDSLSNIVSGYYLTQGYDLPVRYIHRLDNDTSGLLIFVKCTFFLAYLDYSLSIKDIHRYYQAIVEGNIPDTKVHTIHKAIGHDRHNSKKMIIHPRGKDAMTHYRCIKNYGPYALIECKLESGRRHQIRVHMASIHHPLLGDVLYNKPSKKIRRQALHAYCITLLHPVTFAPMEVTCDLPEDIKIILS